MRPLLENDTATSDLTFLLEWVRNPLRTGAVTSSGRDLARAMADPLDPAQPGLVVELGPGTGAMTQALVDRGFPADRLLLVETSPDFRRLLRRRFPGVGVVDGDAFALKRILAAEGRPKLQGVVSSLPLLTQPPAKRLQLLHDAFDAMEPGRPFVQFTYVLRSPIPLIEGIEASRSRRIWRNLPPATVWTYVRRTVEAPYVALSAGLGG